VAGIGFNLIDIGVLVVVLNIAQWLLSPYLIGLIYKVRELPQNENPQLHQMVDDLSRKSGISKPKLMLAQIPLPNAFAYGSPLAGSRVAVTQGLLKSLDDGEVEAVLGHELGHLKHRDVQVMMVVSFLPALFYYIGYSLMLSGIFGGGQRKNGGGSNALIGIFFMAFSWILTLFTLYLSRLREYYADRHSVSVVDNDAEKLSTGLASIVHSSKNASKPKNGQKQSNSAFKALFISDPDRASADSAALNGMNYSQSKSDMVNEILSKQPTFADKLLEVLSTHPNIVKRLKALQELQQNPSSF
jgi:heat shock protein HtpX